MGIAAQPFQPAPGPEPEPNVLLVALLARLAVGDEQALAELYDATSSRVYALAMQILRERGAAEEAALEAYTQIWQQAARYDASKGTPLAWLLMVTRTRAIDLLRSRSRTAVREESLEAARSLADPSASPESSTADGQSAARIRRALATLPVEQREALLAAYFVGMSHSEVAAALGQPLGTVKTRIRAGLQQLRRVLEATGDIS